MNFVPINGLRMLAVETVLLVAFTMAAYLFLRVVPVPVVRPHWLTAILTKNSRAVWLVIAVALVGRAVLLPWVGVPQPRINDEFSYLLMGDTFAHFRLTNPTPAAWRHFETFHVNLIPTYQSKYPVAQGLALAFGESFFGQPWLGILLSTAWLCGAICWTLQAFVPPGWALLGGLLATLRLALFSYWVNSYWGGSLAALSGALALGAAVRLFDDTKADRDRRLLASLFAMSLLLLATSRPFEGFAFSLPLLAYCSFKLLRATSRRKAELRSIALPVVTIGVAGLLLMGYYNHRVTGKVLLMPYVLNERTYASIPLFFGQHVSFTGTPHDPVFTKYYLVEAAEHNIARADSASGLFALEVQRVWSDWFFYVGPALSLPLVLGVLLCWKRRDLRLVLACSITTGIAVALCSFSQAHYFAPATITVYVFVIAGIHYLWEQQGRGERASAIAACLTVAVVCLTRNTATSAMNSTYRFPDTRREVARQLENQPGKHLVLVTYDMEGHYPGDELVHNGADFPTQRVLWARSKGNGNDSDLCAAYGDRTLWSVTTDDVSYSLTPLRLCPTQPSSTH